MTKRKFRSVVPLILAVALLTSACFQIRFFRQDPASLALGEQGVVRLDLHRVSLDENNTAGYTFLLIGWEDADLKLDGTRKFDHQGNFGGPFDRVKNNALRNVLLTMGNCVANGIDAANITGMTSWRAYRTTVKMDSTAGTADDPFKIAVRFTRLFTDDDGRGNFVIFSGTWADLTLNDIPDPGEMACAGLVFSSYSGSGS